jgi:hypothetical protein
MDNSKIQETIEMTDQELKEHRAMMREKYRIAYEKFKKDPTIANEMEVIDYEEYFAATSQ